MDADIDQSIDLLTSELQTGELLHQFCRIPQSTNASLSVAEAAQEELATSDGRNQRGSVGSTTSEESPAEQNKIVWTQVDVSPAPSLPKTVYFVSQTPTASTMESFWQSVWESRSAVIISLQKDFTKSHRYFPNLNECMEADQLLISNIREVKRTSWFFSTKSYMMREFSIIHLNSHRELLVQQFQ